MTASPSTCWTVIEAAAAGRAAERDEFARRYAAAVRTYLAARWRSSPCLHDLDDALQEGFVECLKRGGVLQKAERGRGGFRGFLFGVVRNVALRFEAGEARRREQQPRDTDLDRLAGTEEDQARAFDRAWARAVVREAAVVQEERARAFRRGGGAPR